MREDDGPPDGGGPGGDRGGELDGDNVVNELAPQERDIAMVFQNYALYPHMTVYGNIAYPLESQHEEGRSASG